MDGLVDVKALPGRRDQHRQRVTDVTPTADEQLERVVQHGGVGSLVVDDGDQQ